MHDPALGTRRGLKRKISCLQGSNPLLQKEDHICPQEDTINCEHVSSTPSEGRNSEEHSGSLHGLEMKLQ
jgi:hypothetical protein